jgi:magnesium/cobalt transport protein CorA
LKAEPQGYRNAIMSPPTTHVDDARPSGVANAREAVVRTHRDRIGTAGGAGASPPSAFLYDARGQDCRVDLTAEGLPKLDDDALLWIELGSADEALESVAHLLGLPEVLLRSLQDDEPSPRLAHYDDCLHVRVVSLADGPKVAPSALDAVAGRNWLLTVHRHGSSAAATFREAFKGETELGRLDSLSFLAAVLESQIGGYFAAIDTVEKHIDELDEQVMRSTLVDGDDALGVLVAMRRTLALVRRYLTLHRDVYTTLADPDLTSLASTGSAERFRALLTRLERAVDAAESTRQMIAGSFEILMTRTNQRTNDIMKLLTLVSAALLPSSVIAGVLGMNFDQPFFDLDFLFWAALGLMATLMVGALVLARRRNWL